MNFHDTLNPEIWDNFELKTEVRDKLLEIANAFIEYAEIPLEGVKDIVLTGSSANYNYTPFSDLDLHIIVDYDTLHKDCPLVDGYLRSTKSKFNADHDITIYGIDVELYAEDMNHGGVSNGLFSVLNNEWVRKPEKIEPTDNDSAVNAKYMEFQVAIDKVTTKEEAEKIKDDMYIMRLTGLRDEGEFSTENLAFKKLRDTGYLDKINKIIQETTDRELSLNNKLDDILISGRSKDASRCYTALCKFRGATITPEEGKKFLDKANIKY